MCVCSAAQQRSRQREREREIYTGMATRSTTHNEWLILINDDKRIYPLGWVHTRERLLAFIPNTIDPKDLTSVKIPHSIL